MATFGRAIEELRVGRGWTRAQVCAWSEGGLAYSTLAGIENGHRAPGVRALAAMAAGLGVAERDLRRLWSLIDTGATDSDIADCQAALDAQCADTAGGREQDETEQLVALTSHLARAQAALSSLTSRPEASAARAARPSASVRRSLRDAMTEGPDVLAAPLSSDPWGSEPDGRVAELTRLAAALAPDDLDALLRLARSLADRDG